MANSGRLRLQRFQDLIGTQLTAFEFDFLRRMSDRKSKSFVRWIRKVITCLSIS
jgi:hypothetical protein